LVLTENGDCCSGSVKLLALVRGIVARLRSLGSNVIARDTAERSFIVHDL
jgi:hypothetical protein